MLKPNGEIPTGSKSRLKKSHRNNNIILIIIEFSLKDSATY